eukprot:6205475-Amphidinium_carterae.1
MVAMPSNLEPAISRVPPAETLMRTMRFCEVVYIFYGSGERLGCSAHSNLSKGGSDKGRYAQIGTVSAQP